MAALLLAFCGFALLDFLNAPMGWRQAACCWLIGAPQCRAVSFIAGVFAVTTTFGVCWCWA